MLRLCIVAGHTFEGTGSRCPAHSRKARRNQKLRAVVAASSSICTVCGKAASLSNPMTADHLLPQYHGGQDTEANLRPVCRSCNSSMGAKG